MVAISAAVCDTVDVQHKLFHTVTPTRMGKLSCNVTMYIGSKGMKLSLLLTQKKGVLFNTPLFFYKSSNPLWCPIVYQIKNKYCNMLSALSQSSSSYPLCRY